MSTENTTRRSRPVALITGASSGIGLELAKLFAADGYALVLVARERDKLLKASAALERAYKIPTKAIAKDLGTDTAAAELFTECKRAKIVPDVLVNCAGFGDWGEFYKTERHKNQAMIKTNVNAVVDICRLFLPEMVKREQGRILNVASIAAFSPGPMMAVYYATKAFVSSFSQALAEELREEGITISVLCPPPTESKFDKNANTARSALYKGKLMSAEEVALIGYKGLFAGKTVILAGANTKLLVFAARFTPRSLATRIVAHWQRRLY